jgi:hypothetical protein
MTKLLYDDNTLKYNSNECSDRTQLKWVNHYLGFNFPPIPFLWHYNDFAQPYPVHSIQKVDSKIFNTLVKKNGYNHNLNRLISKLKDKTTDFYILAQYKKENYWYNECSDPNEIYLSYHTWMHINHTKNFCINNIDKYSAKYKYFTGLYSLNKSKISESKDYPKKKYKTTFYVDGGISVNRPTLCTRQSHIHSHNNHIKFSSANVCNFMAHDDDIVFVSIIENPLILNKNKIIKLSTDHKKFNCVTLHIFRNKGDNLKDDNEYNKLIGEYFITN